MPWTVPLLTNIFLMLHPEESVQQLKLFKVSKTFKAALDEVISFQLHQSKSKINAL